MNKMKKFALIAVCAMLLVCVTIGATVAYLTSQGEVVNTFTVGKVKITLDEAKVNPDGTLVEDADRVQNNTYHLMPGHEYEKDPTVHVEAGSEDCWVFVKVTNQIAEIVSDDTNIENQITRNDWEKLADVDGVYYREYTKGASVDYLVFDGFKVSEGVNNDKLAGYAPVEDPDGGEDISKQIIVMAYAIQKDGFDTAADAWEVVSASA